MTKHNLIRPIKPSDTPTLVAMAARYRRVQADRDPGIAEVLDDYHAQNAADGHRAVALETEGAVVGFAYFAAAAMTDRTWSLWWIVVDRECKHEGSAASCCGMSRQRSVRAAAGRQLLIETSSLPKYELTRRFYLKYGYSQIAAVKDYYAEADDMLFFCKRMD